MIMYWALSLLMSTVSLNALNDLEWSSLAKSIANRAEKNSVLDREAAINAYRQISREATGLAQDTAQTLNKAFNGIALPKRFAEMSDEEIRIETQNLVTKTRNEGGYKEFLSAQNITATVK